ncbi:MAG: MFS transporter [Planctomycetales bacterium]|nr:MFS transporter [Planctomycetales bacterium]
MPAYLSENRALRLLTLCVLYSAQGIPDGFVRTALKNYLYSRDVSVAATGTVIAMVSWPWMLKWIWGPVIDRHGYPPMGRRRPWILFAQLMMGVSLVGLWLTPDLASDLRMLAAMVLAVNVFASLQDVAVDALAIDLLPASERGAANGFMYASSFAGNFVGGKVLGDLLVNQGLSSAMSLQIALLAIIGAFPLLLRERRGDVLLPWFGGSRDQSKALAWTRPDSMGDVLRKLRRAYSIRSTLLGAVLATLTLLTVNAHFVYWPQYVQEQLGWKTTDWLTLEGGWGSACGLAGAVAMGLVSTACGAKRTVAASMIAVGCCWLAYTGLHQQWTSPRVIATLFVVEQGLAAAVQVSLFSLFMGICSPAVAATQFTSYMALMNLGNALGAKFAATITSQFGIVHSHTALALTQFALVGVALAIDPDQTRRELGEETEQESLAATDGGLPFPPDP